MFVISPAPHRVVSFKRNGVVSSRANGAYVCEAGYLDRCSGTGGVPRIKLTHYQRPGLAGFSCFRSQLPIVIVSPCPNCTIGFNRDSMTIPGSYSDNLCEAGYLDRSGGTGVFIVWRIAGASADTCFRCCGTQLSVSIISPRPDRAVGFKRNAMLSSCLNSGNVRKATYLYQGRAVYRCSISQLAVFVPSPRPDRAV